MFSTASSDLPSALTYVIATIVLLAVVVLLIIVILIFRQKRHSQDAMKNVEEGSNNTSTNTNKLAITLCAGLKVGWMTRTIWVTFCGLSKSHPQTS